MQLELGGKPGGGIPEKGKLVIKKAKLVPTPKPLQTGLHTPPAKESEMDIFAELFQEESSSNNSNALNNILETAARFSQIPSGDGPSTSGEVEGGKLNMPRRVVEPLMKVALPKMNEVRPKKGIDRKLEKEQVRLRF